MPSARQMRLGPSHLERLVPPAEDDPTPPAGAQPSADEDYDRFVASMLAGAGDGSDVWVFAYGSLIWKPAYEFVEIRTGLLRGWHRAFCLGWNTRFRGSPTNPGLMLALDRGGACKGVLYRLPPGQEAANLQTLVRREMSFKPSPFPPRWVTVASDAGPVRAITFCIDRNSGRYVGGLDEEQLADVLARAVGSRGSMAEYLYNTVDHLERLGIHDPHLWRLQELVAQRLEAMG